MSICFSHLTADTILRKLHAKGELPEPASSAVLRDFRPDLDAAREIACSLGVRSDENLDILVGDQKYRRKHKTITTHLCAQQPPEGSFYRLEEGIYLPTPCFTLLQQANELHIVKLCQTLGYHLGSPIIETITNGVTTTTTLPALLTEEHLYQYLLDCKKFHGITALKQALQLTCAGAASPQETNLQLIMTLPTAYGGFALPKPILNYEIELSPAAQALYPHASIRVDAYWVDWSRGLEFQGKHHKNQIGDDYARLYAAKKDGIDLLFVASEQIHSAAQMKFLGQTMAKKLDLSTRTIRRLSEEDVQWLLDVMSGKVNPSKGERRRAPRRRQRRVPRSG